MTAEIQTALQQQPRQQNKLQVPRRLEARPTPRPSAVSEASSASSSHIILRLFAHLVLITSAEEVAAGVPGAHCCADHHASSSTSPTRKCSTPATCRWLTWTPFAAADTSPLKDVRSCGVLASKPTTSILDRPIRGESHLDFLGESEGSLPPPHDSFPDAGEAINDFWSMSGNLIYRHHVEPRVKLCSPREESFPIPLKYIDVSRTTHTNLDVKQEKRIDDYWNVDGSRDLSDPWTGSTQFTLLEEKPPEGYMWSGERLTRKQLTSRPDHLWPELWKSMGKYAKLKEKQKWLNEKLHLEKARKFRGIYFIDLEDKEFKETIKNARKKLETPIAPVMPCKIMKMKCGSGGSNKIKTKLACILEADESTRLRMGNSLPNHHEDHIAGKRDNSLQHYNLVMLIPDAKAAVEKEWEKLEKILAWQLTKVRNKKEVIDEARTWSRKVGICTIINKMVGD